jgi:SSS family solute:Na+ symporter
MDIGLSGTQTFVFLGLTALIGLLTWWFCRGTRKGVTGEQDYFLAGGSLKWYFVAGSITLTNLSTDQLIGMNGNQMALLAWWELSAFIGLLMLAFIFIPVYYKYNCTTTTELLERRYNNPHIRALISVLFLAGNVLIFLPAILYGGSLILIQTFGLEAPLMELMGTTKTAEDTFIGIHPVFPVAIIIALIGSAYAIFGGLRAVAVSDTISGVLILGIAALVTYLSLQRINFDISNIPTERLSMIGRNDSPIPFATLFTGMLFIQMFYWSTNQTITQRAMASPSVKEAQKGIFAAAAIRLLIVPPIIVIPGIVSFELFGKVDDNLAYGQIITEVLPPALLGAFAAALLAAVLTTFNSILNASAALWVVDIHETYINKTPNVKRLAFWVSIVMVALSFLLIPVFLNASNLINVVQELYGYLSMPILSAFIVGLLFRNVNANAVIISTLFGVLLYGFFLNVWPAESVFGPRESRNGLYIHFMAITLFSSVAVALFLNRFAFGNKAVWDAHNVFARGTDEERNAIKTQSGSEPIFD